MWLGGDEGERLDGMVVEIIREIKFNRHEAYA